MKCVLFTLSGKLQSWITNLRVISALLLGLTLAARTIMHYLSFARAVGTAVQIFEAYIYISSSTSSFRTLALGSFLLLSDAPFITLLSQHEMLRIGRKKWLWGQIVYVFAASLLYSLTLLVFASLLSCITGESYLLGGWSSPMELLAVQQPDFAVRNFNASFPYPEMLQAVSPIGAALIGLIFNSMYLSLISLLILCVNLLTKQNYGWIVGGVVHFANYMIYANGNFGMNVKNSLRCCAVPSYHYNTYLGMSGSYCFFVLFVCIFIVIGICRANAHRIEPFL